MYLSIEDQFIFSSIKSHFQKNEVEISDLMITSAFNWDTFCESVIRNGVAPFFHRNIINNSKTTFPPIVNSKFKATYYKTLSRNIFLYEQFDKLLTEFSKANISVIVLKGIFLADNIYKDIGLRQLSDIDLLLKYQDIETAGTILMRLGFENLNRKLKKDFNKNKHFNFQKEGVMVELHQHIYPYTENFKVDIGTYWKNAESTKISKSETFVLADIDLIQQLCIHLYIHIRIGKFSLISFCDIITFILSRNGAFNWNLLFDKCNEDNCLIEVSNILLITQKYFGKFIPKSSLSIISEYSNANLEERFISIFQGNDLRLSVATQKINAIKMSNGLREKINYFIKDVFQIKEFMIYRYNPKCPKLYFFYYPVRMVSAVYKYLVFNGKIKKKEEKLKK